MQKLKILAGLLALAAIAGGLWWYWRHEGLFPSTEDAYVQANIVSVAAEISGQVTEVAVGENEYVEAGALLFRLDGRAFEDAAAEAQAQLDAVRQGMESYREQVRAAESAVRSANTAKKAADSQLSRSENLFAKGDVTQVRLDQDRASAAQAQAALDAAQYQLASARAALAGNRDTLATARAQLRTARTNLARTEITSPTAGWISNITLREGSVVSAYAPLFSIVDASRWWVEANFKETDLPGITPGLPATVSVDLIPGHTLTGQVASIGRGSGATFALLPAQNATGNWVKVTQRFPVRIALETHGRADIEAGLRVGASASVTVDTTAPAGDPGSAATSAAQ